MYRTLGIFLLGLVLTAGLGSCRVNNGDIGPLYGVWVVTSVEVDGEAYHAWQADGTSSFFEFQNNIVFVTRNNALHDAITQAGTWEWLTPDTELSLNFTHSDDRFPTPGSGQYAPPSWLLLTAPGVYDFDVVWKGDKAFSMTTVNSAGQRLTYHLKKTY